MSILVLMQQRGIGLGRSEWIKNMGQHLIFNINQFQCVAGDPFTGRRNTSNRVAVIKYFFPGHDIA